MRLRRFSWMITIIILLYPRALALPMEINLNGNQTAIVMDADSREVYWDKSSHQVMYPASTTKVLTAIVVLENTKLEDMVTVSDHAIDSIIGSTMWLEYGESQTVENLLYGLLMVSANDAAVALAEHVSGSVEAFAEKMNEKAMELGATHSHFSNPHGLHEPDHYSTAYDMAIIFSDALKHPEFLRIANTSFVSMPWHGKTEPREIYHATLQALPYPWVIANKNGYTDEAGQTLVYGAQKDSTRFVAVIMNSQDIWNEMDYVLNIAYEAINRSILIQKGTDLEFGTSKWKMADDLTVVTGQSLNQDKNYLLKLDPVSSRLKLEWRETMIAEESIQKTSSLEEVWYESPWVFWIPWLVIPCWISFFRAMLRAKSKQRNR